MGNLDFSANADQLKELAAYMASQINVPTIGIGGGYAPIGSINFFDATTAPQDWLACDGTVYNIADYPQLADWYEAQHGSKNFYGGDGTTTFAVPDLQGEFLRGTGTNSHTNQGSGANVGEHQDATEIPLSFSYNNEYLYNSSSGIESVTYSNEDSLRKTSSRAVARGTKEDSNLGIMISLRPTNTSFLICVKAVVAGDVYSTEERVVGTWIDGKPVYQKTFTGETVPTALRTVLASNIDTVINGFGMQTYGESGELFQFPFIRSTLELRWLISTSHELVFYREGIDKTACTNYRWTFQYTKTTD